MSGLPDGYHEHIPLALTGMTPEYVDAMFNCPPCVMLSSIMPIVRGRPRFVMSRASAGMNEAMRREGAVDMLGLRAEDGSARGIQFAAPRPEVERLDRRDAATLMRVLAHVAAGNRLFHDERRAAETVDEAILTPAGRIEHAVGVAKEQRARVDLAHAASRIDRARGKLRRVDPEAAVEEWRALVAGRWSLIDHFDSDGRRYLIARRNEQQPRLAKRRLSGRERQVAALAVLGHSNKLIGYELGLATSTVSAYLASASRKLAITSRVELVRAMSPRSGGAG
jgi:DNA-binding CsgD family transcriptional regulator